MPKITYQVDGGSRRPSAVAQLERLLRDVGFDDIAALTAEQTIEFPSVLDYMRFQAARDIDGSYEPVVVEVPSGPI